LFKLPGKLDSGGGNARKGRKGSLPVGIKKERRRGFFKEWAWQRNTGERIRKKGSVAPRRRHDGDAEKKVV